MDIVLSDTGIQISVQRFGRMDSKPLEISTAEEVEEATEVSAYCDQGRLEAP
jgi:hypothetical protein